MLGIFIAGALLLTFGLLAGSFLFLGLLVRGLLWMVLLPLRLVFGAVALLFAIPFVVVGVALALAVGLVALLTPLLPFALIGLGIWAVVKASRRRPVAVAR